MGPAAPRRTTGTAHGEEAGAALGEETDPVCSALADPLDAGAHVAPGDGAAGGAPDDPASLTDASGDRAVASATDAAGASEAAAAGEGGVAGTEPATAGRENARVPMARRIRWPTVVARISSLER
jgi:hypothetical protein